MAYEILDTDSCIANIIITGGKGMITNMSCLDVVNAGDAITVSIEYLNDKATAESWALLFCASTDPHTTCDIKQYVSDAFVLSAGESGINYQQFIMPEKSVAYTAELQRWDVTSEQWVSEDSKSCTVNIPGRDSTNILPYVGAGIIGLMMLAKK